MRTFYLEVAILISLVAILISMGLSIGSVYFKPRTPEAVDSSTTREALLEALCFVESGCRELKGVGPYGEIGPYQITAAYWEDALHFSPSIGGTFQDCLTKEYSEQVIAAYMQRWVPRAWYNVDAEIIARTHNGGPYGGTKPSTLPYWAKVQAALEGQD